MFINSQSFDQHFQQGFTLLEVLITLIVLTFGVLGLANLQAKLHVAESESYQRAQAVILLEDMVSRIKANRANAANYVTVSPLGVGEMTACAADQTVTENLDKCQWSTVLKGAAETKGGGCSLATGANCVGAMLGARGCIELVQAADPSAAACLPGIYRVSVVWQGLNPTASPSLTCGSGSYGDDAMRRVISSIITIGLPGCLL